METSIGPEHRIERVGVALAFAFQDGLIQHTPPSAGRGIVNIIEIAAIATGAVAITKEKIAAGVFEKNGIRAPRLAFASHAIEALERRDIEGLFRAVINERIHVHVA